jgi:hypothetical protein
MEKLILILIVLVVVFFGGSMAAKPLDLSAGPRAEGQLALDQANATRITTQAGSNQQTDAETLRDQQLINDQTRPDRVNTAHWIWVTCAIFGSLSLALILIFSAVNVMAFFGIVNYRFAVMPIGHRSGQKVGWVLPLLPTQLILTDDSAPGLSTLIRHGEQPVLTESQDPVGLALAHAIAASPVPEKTNVLYIGRQISDMLNGIRTRRLPENASIEQ